MNQINESPVTKDGVAVKAGDTVWTPAARVTKSAQPCLLILAPEPCTFTSDLNVVFKDGEKSKLKISDCFSSEAASRSAADTLSLEFWKSERERDEREEKERDAQKCFRCGKTPEFNLHSANWEDLTKVVSQICCISPEHLNNEFTLQLCRICLFKLVAKDDQ